MPAASAYAAAWIALAFAGSLLASWVGTYVAAAPLRAAPSGTWVERARLAYPPRRVAAFCLLGLPVYFALVAAWMPGTGRPEATPLLVAAIAFASFVAASLVRLHVERTVRGTRFGAGQMLGGWVALWLVMLPHLLLGVVAVAFVSDGFDGGTLLACALVVVGVLAAFSGVGVVVARVLRLARPGTGRLQRAVAAAAGATGIHPRGVFEVDLNMANALALPLARMLLFTTQAVEALDESQIAAIARHELGHVSEPRRVIAMRLLGATVIVGALVLARPVSGIVAGDDPTWRLVAALAVIVAAFVFARLLVRPLARKMEERADAIARAHDAHDGEYARALEAIYAANLMPAVAAAKKAVHPHLYDRLVAAGVTPAWPRPAPPSSGRIRGALFACMGVALLVLAIFEVLVAT
jgi:Zn-dependent protease with chaperone function